MKMVKMRWNRNVVIIRIVCAALVIAVLSLTLQKSSQVHADTGYTVTGTVQVNSTAIANALVRYTGLTSVRTDQNGNYTITNVPSGSYSVTINYSLTGASGIPKELGLNNITGTELTVNGADTTKNYNFTIPAQQINVVDTKGAQVSNSQVTMNLNKAGTYSYDGNTFQVGDLMNTATTDATGEATVYALNGINYQLCATDVGGSQVCNNIISDNVTNPLTAVVPAAALVSGMVTVNGVAIPNSLVRLTGPHSYSTRTDQNGNYSIASVPAGSYTVDINYSMSGLGLAPKELAATKNTTIVVNGTDVISNLALSTDKQQRVMVIDYSGNPIVGSHVTSTMTSSSVSESDGYRVTELNNDVLTDSIGAAMLPMDTPAAFRLCASLADGSQVVCKNISASASGNEVVMLVGTNTCTAATTTSSIIKMSSPSVLGLKRV